MPSMSQLQVNLQASASDVYFPATVGFLLTGVTIADLKIWHFGGNVIGPICDLVYNYYDFPVGSHDVYVEVGAIVGGKFSRTGLSNTLTVNVNPRKPEFDVYQTEAVISNNNFVGFALSTNLTGDQEKYDSGDGQTTDWSPRNLNPWIKYENANTSPYTGKITISGFESGGKKYIGYQDFNVLVYSDDTVTGSIAILPTSDPHPSIPDGAYAVNYELTFQANVSNNPTSIVSSLWDFGDKSSPQRGSGPDQQVSYQYQNPGNYLVKCTLTMIVENSQYVTLTLYKTVVIMNP